MCITIGIWNLPGINKNAVVILAGESDFFFFNSLLQHADVIGRVDARINCTKEQARRDAFFETSELRGFILVNPKQRREEGREPFQISTYPHSQKSKQDSSAHTRLTEAHVQKRGQQRDLSTSRWKQKTSSETETGVRHTCLWRKIQNHWSVCFNFPFPPPSQHGRWNPDRHCKAVEKRVDVSFSLLVSCQNANHFVTSYPPNGLTV